MIERVLTFVSGVEESALVDFISQNRVKILHEVKTCQNCLYQKFSYKNEHFIFFLIFELLLKFYPQFYLILNFWNSYSGCTIITIMRAVIEKEIALIMREIVIVDA